MAGRGYLNTFYPQTPTGEIMQNLSQILFGGSSEDEAKAAVYKSQIGENNARARYLAAQTAEKERSMQLADENAAYLQLLRQTGSDPRNQTLSQMTGLPALVVGQQQSGMSLPNPIDPTTRTVDPKTGKPVYQRYISQADENMIGDAGSALTSYLVGTKAGVSNPASMQKAIGEAQDNRFMRGVHDGSVPVEAIQRVGWLSGRNRYNVDQGMQLDQLAPSMATSSQITPIGSEIVNTEKFKQKTEGTKQLQDRAQAGVANANAAFIKQKTQMLKDGFKIGQAVLDPSDNKWKVLRGYDVNEMPIFGAETAPPKSASGGAGGQALSVKQQRDISVANDRSITALEQAEAISQQLSTNPDAKNNKALKARLEEALKVINKSGFALNGDPANDQKVASLRSRLNAVATHVDPKIAQAPWYQSLGFGGGQQPAQAAPVQNGAKKNNVTVSNW